MTKKVFSTECFQSRDEIQEFMETRFINLLKSTRNVSGVIEDRNPKPDGCVLKLSFEFDVSKLLQLTTLSNIFLTERNDIRPVYMDGEPDAGGDWETFMDFRDPQPCGTRKWKSLFYVKNIPVTFPPRYDGQSSVSCFLPIRWTVKSETRFEFEVFPLKEWKYGGGFQLDRLETQEKEVA